MNKDWLDLARGDIAQALEDTDFFLNRPNHFLFENCEQMREEAIDFCGTVMNCLEEAGELAKKAAQQEEALQ